MHDDGSIHEAFNRVGLPLLVLIDAQGKIVYYKGGEDDYGLRAAIAALGPQCESLAPVPKPKATSEITSKQTPTNCAASPQGNSVSAPFALRRRLDT